MNWKHVVLAGLMLGLVMFVAGTILFLALGPPPELLEESLGRPINFEGALVATVLAYLCVGVVLMWLYAAIRPRYGPGPMTAARAAFAVWLVAALVDIIWYPLSVMPASSMAVLILAGLPIVIGLTMAAASTYQEPGDPSEAASPAD